MRNGSPRPCERRGAGRDRLLRRLVSTDTIGCTLDAPQQVSVGGSKRPGAPQRIDGKVGADNNNNNDNKGFNDLFGFVGASVHEDEPSSICDGLHAPDEHRLRSDGQCVEAGQPALWVALRLRGGGDDKKDDEGGSSQQFGKEGRRARTRACSRA